MSARHYRLLLAVAASVSLLAAGCSSERAPDPVTGAAAPQTTRRVPMSQDTEETLFTVLGLAKRPADQQIGPQTGSSVSPVLWQATQETLRFAGISSEDPMTGLYVTDWYSPPTNRAQRLRVSVFILSRALRSDSLAVNIDRQERSPDGQWHDSPIARDAVAGLENAILLRARQIHAERYRNTM